MYTLIRRLKLKDKRTKSYNMNKKQNCTNFQWNTANKKRRWRYTYIVMAMKNYIKQYSTAFGDNSIQLGGKNYNIIKLRVAQLQRKLLQANQNNKKTKPYIYKNVVITWTTRRDLTKGVNCDER